MIVVDKIAFDGIKTKNMVKVLGNLKADKAYVVINGMIRMSFFPQGTSRQ